MLGLPWKENRLFLSMWWFLSQLQSSCPPGINIYHHFAKWHTHFCQVRRDTNSQHNAVSSIKRKTDKLKAMYSPLLIEKAEEAAQYSSEPLGDGRDAAAHTREKCFQSVSGVCSRRLMWVREKERLGGSGGAIVCWSRLSVHASVLL